VRSHCAYPCQCTNRDPVCEPGVPHTRDGCGCCPVCARQDGDPCDGIAVCDQRKGLVCQYDDYYSAAGVCRADYRKHVRDLLFLYSTPSAVPTNLPLHELADR
ncbi:protein CYR61, partial [Aphis craccivora]